MQVLLFRLGADCYGLNTRNVVRVLPLLELKQLPGTPDYVAGLMNYQGKAVPVLDLSLLGGGSASNAFFATRIVLVNYPAPDGDIHLLGLIAESVSGVLQAEDGSFSATGIVSGGAPYLGLVAPSVEGMLQLVDVDRLLPDAVRAILFQPAQQAVPC